MTWTAKKITGQLIGIMYGGNTHLCISCGQVLVQL